MKIKISQRARLDTSPPPPLPYPDNSTAIGAHTVGAMRRLLSAGAGAMRGAVRIISVLRCAACVLVTLTRAGETLRLVMDYGRPHTTGSASARLGADVGSILDLASIHTRTLSSPPLPSIIFAHARTLALAHRHFARSRDRVRTHTRDHTR